MQRHWPYLWPNPCSKYHCEASDVDKGDRLGNERSRCLGGTDVNSLGIGKVLEILWLGVRGTGGVGAGNCL